MNKGGGAKARLKARIKARRSEGRGSGWTQAFSDTRGKILSFVQSGERNPQLRTGVITNNHSLPGRVKQILGTVSRTQHLRPPVDPCCTRPTKEVGSSLPTSCKATSFTAEIDAYGSDGVETLSLL